MNNLLKILIKKFNNNKIIINNSIIHKIKIKFNKLMKFKLNLQKNKFRYIKIKLNY